MGFQLIFHIPSRPDLVRSGLDDDLEKLLSDYGRSRGVRYIRANLSDDDYLKLDGHLSPKGAKSAAKALANGLNIGIDGLDKAQ